jgi:lantibiotic leader peptide-processing serine protease
VRKVLLVALAVLVAAALALPASAGTTGRAALTAQAQSSGQLQSANGEYVVAYADGASAAAARAAIKAAGGTILKENTRVGVATVKSSKADFIAAAGRQSALVGAARNQPIGKAPSGGADKDSAERLTAAERAAVKRAAGGADHRNPNQEPLADKQWDMRMIDATPSGSYRVNQGRRGVMVGIIDTGVDGSHPDIKPNFNRALSRNFTTDIPLVDGPCEHPSCVDPADEDDNGHGTHVAGLVGAALNGLGTAGVAPRITLVNIRAGQDSGFFFLQPTIDALVYAGLVGIDVVNMSFVTDLWLYNCLQNPADSPEEQLEQLTVRVATPAGGQLRQGSRRHSGGRARQRTHRPRPPHRRHHQPRLPARLRAHPHRRQLLHHRADRDPRGDLDLRPRPERLQGRLLQLRHRADRLLGPGRVVPRLLRAPAEPPAREREPVSVSRERRHRQRRPES